MAALSYAPDDGGLAAPELGLTLSRDAVVVRRKIPRVTPGEPLPCAAPIAIGVDEQVVFLALGVAADVPLDIEAMEPTWSNRAAGARMLLVSAAAGAFGTEARGVLRSTATEQVQKVSLSETS
jgi:hypothetical protein